MKFVISLFVALMCTFSQVTASACGDSLYRVGRGVSYRTYSAPLPGNLLVYATSESSRQLAAELAESGHNVILVASTEDLVAELSNGEFDLFIAPLSERQAVEFANTASFSSATFLPLAANSEEERQAKDAYGEALSSDDGIKRHLRAIHGLLRNKA
jgi:hypothetical protein